MDILVTTPKSEIENSKKEAELIKDGEGYYFRTFPNKPNVESGDKIYFVENGMIRGYGIIFDSGKLEKGLKDGMKCEATGRLWGEKGGYVVMYHKWKWITPPVPFKGFQGYRYIERIKIKCTDCDGNLCLKCGGDGILGMLSDVL